MNLSSFKLDQVEANFSTEISDQDATFGMILSSRFTHKNKSVDLDFFKKHLHLPTNQLICAIAKIRYNSLEFLDCLFTNERKSFIDSRNKSNGDTLLTERVKKAVYIKHYIDEGTDVFRHIEINKTFGINEVELLTAYSNQAEHLINLGANINARFFNMPLKSPIYCTRRLETSLDLALTANFSSIVRKLIAHGGKALAVCEDASEFENAQKSLNEAVRPLIRRIQLLPLTGNGSTLPRELIDYISKLLLASCSATFYFPEEALACPFPSDNNHC